jgi:predicted metal-binding membrane protein
MELGKDAGGTRSPVALVVLRKRWALGIVVATLVSWAFLAWVALDMGHPFVQLMMPASSNWTGLNVLALFCMWTVMMAAMMLPSALPMVVTFVTVAERNGDVARGRVFVAAYLAVWFIFSAVAAAAQWALQRIGWVDPMIVSTSPLLTGALLLIAGVYQFSRLKRICLSRCRTPFAFLLGEWRPGVGGAFVMGARHGLLCVGCCWALMALLFVGGVMNLAWVAALAIGVAAEKLMPLGDRLAPVLGMMLVVLGSIRLLAILA